MRPAASASLLSTPILLAALAGACASHPLGTPVPSAEAVAIRSELAALLLSSGRYDEAAREYGRLLRLDDSEENRLGLARALAWGGRFREAEPHLRVLAVQRPRDAAVDSLVRSVRANLEPDVAEAKSWVAERPSWMPYREALVRALIADGRVDDALTQIDLILATEPDPDLLVQRARILILRREPAAAEEDLRRSIAIRHTAAAWIAIGDLRRSEGELAEARVAYEHARLLSPRDREVAAAFARLERDERPALAGLAVPGQEIGYSGSFGAVDDNAGVSYTRLSARRGVQLGDGFSGSVGLEHRYLRDVGEAGVASHGVAGEVAVAGAMGWGELSGSIGVGVGGVHHGGDGTLPTVRVAALGAYRAWVGGGELARGPAYPSLMTGASLRPDDGRSPLRERSRSLVLGGPLGRTDAAVVWQRAEISDGNTRTSLTLSVRHPLARRLSAVYSGQGIVFALRSPLYWDPSGYFDNAFGLEYEDRRLRGVSVAARGRIGVAWSEDAPFVRASIDRGDAGARFRVDLASELGYTADRWHAGVSYSLGRVSGYQRHEGAIAVRFIP
ncbi:MAG: tetratricopeptide repeat protein [Longimicrobiales bacterium]